MNHTAQVVQFTAGVPVEDAARDQIRLLAHMPFVKHIAVMPDVHSGKGSTVGTVFASEGAVIPAAVGVDIGCVDADTEFLSPEGWKRIADWDNDVVMNYNPATGKGEFVFPEKYIKLPCSEFMYIHSKYGVNQCLDYAHKVLYAPYDRSYSFAKRAVISSLELKSWHDRTKEGFRGRFLTTFKPELGCSLPWYDAEIRVILMCAADGHFPYETGSRCYLRFRKHRKIIRARKLLSEAGIPFTESPPDKKGTVSFLFYSPARIKALSLWEASAHQLEVISEEVLNWDGNQEDHCFYTSIKESADFISYAFAATGKRSVMRVDTGRRGGKDEYRVFGHSNTSVGINGSPKTPIKSVPSPDGFKYCFTVNTGFWVMRRGGCIAMTGNCGMATFRTDLHVDEISGRLPEIRAAIESTVPHGRTDNGGPMDKGRWRTMQNFHPDFWDPLVEGYNTLTSNNPDLARNAHPCDHLGTLGTGNHFIEVSTDEDGMVWIVIHSGSRGVGARIGSLFTEKAKQNMKRWFVDLPDPDLAYLPEGTEDFDEYLQAVRWAQEYARANRRAMMELVVKCVYSKTTPWGIISNILADKFATGIIDCHHNFVAKEHHLGKNLWVTRKGAVRARTTDLAIIPGSMGAKSFVVAGKGNAASLASCSHGAGRIMSRTKAKSTFTLEDHEKATAGIECRKDAEVLDETPGAYKDIDAVMNAQKDLVEIKHTLKQLVCVKG